MKMKRVLPKFLLVGLIAATTGLAVIQPVAAEEGDTSVLMETPKTARIKFVYDNKEYTIAEEVPLGKKVVVYADEAKTVEKVSHVIDMNDMGENPRTFDELSGYEKEGYSLVFQHNQDAEGNLYIWPVYTKKEDTSTKPPVDENAMYNYSFTWKLEGTNADLPWYVNVPSIMSDQTKATLNSEEVKTWLNTFSDRIVDGVYKVKPADEEEAEYITPAMYVFKGLKQEPATGIPARQGGSNTQSNVGYWEELPLKYTVQYSFVSGTEGKSLPYEVLSELPKSYDADYKSSQNAIAPTKKEVKVKDGTWIFDSYSNGHVDSLEENVTFIGTWKFSPKMVALNQIPVITTQDQTLTIGDTFNPLQGVTANDAEDGDVTANIEVLETAVPVDKDGKTTTLGIYAVTYKVTDSQGASSTQTITVAVKERRTEPGQGKNDSESQNTDKGAVNQGASSVQTTTVVKEEQNQHMDKGTASNKKQTSETKGTNTAADMNGLLYSAMTSMTLLMMIGLVYFHSRKV